MAAASFVSKLHYHILSTEMSRAAMAEITPDQINEQVTVIGTQKKVFGKNIAGFTKFLTSEIRFYKTLLATRARGSQAVLLLQKIDQIAKSPGFKLSTERLGEIRDHMVRIGMATGRFARVHEEAKKAIEGRTFTNDVYNLNTEGNRVDGLISTFKTALNSAYYARKKTKGEKTWGDNITFRGWPYLDAAVKEFDAEAEQQPQQDSTPASSAPMAPEPEEFEESRRNLLTYATSMEEAKDSYDDAMAQLLKQNGTLEKPGAISKLTTIVDAKRATFKSYNTLPPFTNFLDAALDKYEAILKIQQIGINALAAVQTARSACTIFRITDAELTILKDHLGLIEVGSQEFAGKHAAASQAIREFTFEIKISALIEQNKKIATLIKGLKKTLNSAFYEKKRTEGKTGVTDFIPSTRYFYLEEAREEKKTRPKSTALILAGPASAHYAAAAAAASPAEDEEELGIDLPPEVTPPATPPAAAKKQTDYMNEI
jgi:hypothetical protein